MSNTKKLLTSLAFLIISMLVSAILVYGIPDGATVVKGIAQTKPATSSGSVVAQGGNITNVNLTATVQTNVWQGFFGEVTGSITLRDASFDQMYSWSLNGLTGEVFASRNSSIPWGSVAGVTKCTIDEALTGTGSDRVNRTFKQNASLSPFTIGTISVTSACETFTYVSNATQQTSFQEIIVNTTGVRSIYATKIYSNTTGFDGKRHDYQMIVPETSTSAVTTYFFFVELG